MRKIKTWARKLLRARRGNVTVMLALSVIPIIAVVGTAIDISRIQTARAQTWALLDQAALAAANLAYEDEVDTLVTDWMDSRIAEFGHNPSDLEVTVQSEITLNSKTVSTRAILRVDTTIMHLFGS